MQESLVEYWCSQKEPGVSTSSGSLLLTCRHAAAGAVRSSPHDLTAGRAFNMCRDYSRTATHERVVAESGLGGVRPPRATPPHPPVPTPLSASTLPPAEHPPAHTPF